MADRSLVAAPEHFVKGQLTKPTQCPLKPGEPTMTNEQIVQIVAAVIAAITPARKTPAIKSKINRFTPKLSPAVVDPRTERQLNRLAAVAKAFNRKGIKNNDMKFKTDSNPTDYNIRTYKGWLTVGRIVKRGEHV